MAKRLRDSPESDEECADAMWRGQAQRSRCIRAREWRDWLWKRMRWVCLALQRYGLPEELRTLTMLHVMELAYARAITVKDAINLHPWTPDARGREPFLDGYDAFLARWQPPGGDTHRVQLRCQPYWKVPCGGGRAYTQYGSGTIVTKQQDLIECLERAPLDHGFLFTFTRGGPILS